MEPSIALDIVRQTRDRDSRIEHLVAAIHRDEKLTRRLHRVVNSSLYARAHRVKTTEEAIVALGTRYIEAVALSLMLIESIKRIQERSHGVNFPQFWRQTISTAIIARMLARVVLPDREDEAYVAGLLADLGVSAMAFSLPDQYPKVRERARTLHRPIHDIERENFGWTHADVAAELLESWGLPEGLCSVIAAHHDTTLESLDADDHALAHIVMTATKLAEIFAGQRSPESILALRAEIVTELNITPLELELILQRVETLVAEHARSLGVKLGPTTPYRAIAADTMRTMLRQAFTEPELHPIAAGCVRETLRHVRDPSAVLDITTAAVASDPVTGLPNLPAFERTVAEWIDESAHTGVRLGLVLCRLRDLRQMETDAGVEEVNAMLAKLADRVARRFGRLGFNACLARGELVLAVRGAKPEAMQVIARELQSTAESSTYAHRQTILRPRIHIGAALLDPHYERFESDDLHRAAECSLDHAREHPTAGLLVIERRPLRNRKAQTDAGAKTGSESRPA